MAEIDVDDFSDVAADFRISSDGYDKEGRPGNYFVILFRFLYPQTTISNNACVYTRMHVKSQSQN